MTPSTAWDLADLHLLVVVAQQGSMGRAAVHLGHSQPTVSRRIRALERGLGVGLLERRTTGSSLTPQGQVVVDWAARVLASAEEFTHAVDLLRGDGQSTVRAAVSMTLAEHHAPAWVGALRRHHPEVSVTLSVQNSARVAELVGSGDADVGFVEGPTVPAELQRLRIGWDRIVIAVRPEHAWAAADRTVTPAEIGAAPLLVREPGSGTRETLEQALRQRNHTLVTGLEMASNTALKSAALAGMGPVALSETALAVELGAGELMAVPTPGLSLRRPLTAIWRDRTPSRATTLLVETARRQQTR